MMLTMGYQVGEGVVLEQDGKVIFRVVVARIDRFRVALSLDADYDASSKISLHRQRFKLDQDSIPPEDSKDKDYVPRFY